MTLYIAWFDTREEIIKKIDESGGWPDDKQELIANKSSIFGSFWPVHFDFTGNKRNQSEYVIMVKQEYLDFRNRMN